MSFIQPLLATGFYLCVLSTSLAIIQLSVLSVKWTVSIKNKKVFVMQIVPI